MVWVIWSIGWMWCCRRRGRSRRRRVGLRINHRPSPHDQTTTRHQPVPHQRQRYLMTRKWRKSFGLLMALTTPWRLRHQSAARRLNRRPNRNVARLVLLQCCRPLYHHHHHRCLAVAFHHCRCLPESSLFHTSLRASLAMPASWQIYWIPILWVCHTISCILYTPLHGQLHPSLQTLTYCLFLVFAPPLPLVVLVLQPSQSGTHSNWHSWLFLCP